MGLYTPGFLCGLLVIPGDVCTINPSVTTSWFCKCPGSLGHRMYVYSQHHHHPLFLLHLFWEHGSQDAEVETGPVLPLVAVNETPKIRLLPGEMLSHLLST